MLLAALLLAAAAPAVADTATQPWKTRVGDNPAWARPELDDSDWPPVPLPSTWRAQERQGYDGIVWFRSVVRLDEEARLAAGQDRLELLLGPPVYGGYEAYAAGRLLGRSRGWSAELPFGFPEVFEVPRELIGEGDTLRLALRVRRVGWASDADPESAPTGTDIRLGLDRALRDRVRAAWADHLMSELPLLVLAAIFAVAGLYNLLLYSRRPSSREHLWLGLLALAFAVNTFASTYWIYELTASHGLALRVSDLTGHLAAALAIQFLWRFFAWRGSRLLRAYQLSHVGLAAFVAVSPSVRPVVASSLARWLWLLLLLGVAAILVVRELRRGVAEARAEARWIAAGGLVMIVVQAIELARNVAHLPVPAPFSLAAFGFAAVLVGMGFALSSRFRRVHEELDSLRLGLEAQVAERTHDLEVARDQALAASRTKSAFLANVSHEIRTPLNGILGMSEILAATRLDSEQRDFVRALQVSGQSLLSLLDEILDFSRMEVQRIPVARAPFRLAEVVAESLEVVYPAAAEKGLTLRSTVAEGTPDSIVGDRDRTRQVLLNLVSNAVKFTSQGEVDVTLSARSLEDGRSEVHFAVSDTGIGIAPEDLDRLFQPFQQLDSSLSRRYGGAGLGLAISKRLTDSLGGEIWVESVPGRGSTFHFTVVGDVGATPLPVPVEPPLPAAEEARPSPLRVLLAEDDEVNQMVVLTLLKHLGHRADLARNGLEALAALERGSYDVVLMDVQMPELDGLEATRRIRHLIAAGEQPYILALTAHAMASDLEGCLAAGMDGYLSKPVRLADLERALSGVAARSAEGCQPLGER